MIKTRLLLTSFCLLASSVTFANTAHLDEAIGKPGKQQNKSYTHTAYLTQTNSSKVGIFPPGGYPKAS